MVLVPVHRSMCYNTYLFLLLVLLDLVLLVLLVLEQILLLVLLLVLLLGPWEVLLLHSRVF